MLLNRSISIGYFINEIKFQIFLIIAFALSMAVFDHFSAFRNVTLPLSVPALVGTAVSLLLAFRTGQSYERWWEARNIWGAIVNDSRSLIRLTIQFLPAESEEEVNAFVRRQIIWNYALGESLRRQPFSEKVQAYLDEHQIQALNIPNAILDQHANQIGRLYKEGKLSGFQQMQLNELLIRLCDSMGRCERIKNTVFPRSYSMLVHTMIYLFAAILPFGLEDSKLLMEVSITIAIPIMFIAIEKTSIIMQDPFENTPVDTPMTALAQTIENNLKQMSGSNDIVPKVDNGLYYEM